MQPVKSNLSAASELSSVLTFKISEPTNLIKTVAPVIEIEEAVIIGNAVIVDYYRNDVSKLASLSLINLKAFVLSTGMNEYCYDSHQNGEHMQDCGSLHLDTFIVENLKDVVLPYLEAGKGDLNVN